MNQKANGDRSPVRGCMVLTRSVEDNRRTAGMCEEEGFRAIEVPMLEYETLDFDPDLIPDDLEECIVLLTSSRATRRWIDLRLENDTIESIHVAAYVIVGKRSATLIAEVDPDVPVWQSKNGVESVQEDVAQAVREGEISIRTDGVRVILYPCSTKRRDVAVENFQRLGFRVVEIPLYVPRRPDGAIANVKQLLDDLPQNATFLFFSPSAVHHFVESAAEANLLGTWKRMLEERSDLAVAAMGETTAEALYSHGVEDVIVPERSELRLLCDAIKAHYSD